MVETPTRMVPDTEKIADALKGMGVGDRVGFSAHRLMTVRAACSNYGAVLGRKFTTNCVRDDKAVYVTRTE